MPLFNIRLELARSKEAPNGDPLQGYEFVAPLDAAGHLDAEAWKAARSACVVRHFKHGVADENGKIVHVGKGWHFDYDGSSRDDDEKLFKLDRHSIVQNEYLSITEHDGVMRTFKVVSVRPLA